MCCVRAEQMQKQISHGSDLGTSHTLVLHYQATLDHRWIFKIWSCSDFPHYTTNLTWPWLSLYKTTVTFRVCFSVSFTYFISLQSCLTPMWLCSCHHMAQACRACHSQAIMGSPSKSDITVIIIVYVTDDKNQSSDLVCRAKTSVKVN